MGSVMADSHITHNFFSRTSVSHFNTTITTTSNNNNNANPMDAFPASSSSPPSPSPSTGSSVCEGQQHHNNKCQHYDHSHSHYNQAQTLYSPSSIGCGSASILTTSAALHVSGGGDGSRGSMPPPNYFAMVVANKLLPEGPRMYGRRSDANCILRVGRRRYFVHVQMLASRSSSFLRIFNEMIINEAWGQDSASSTSGQDDLDCNDSDCEGDDDLDLEYDDPASLDCCSSSSAVGGLGGREASGVHASTTTTTISTTATAATTSTSASTSMSTTPISPSSITEIDNDDHHDHDNDHDSDSDAGSSMMDEDEDHVHVFDLEDALEYGDQEEEEEEEEEELEEDDDTVDDGNDNEENEKIPTLNLKLSRPVGSRFDEMLYWIYTNDSDRWRRCFTPENYSSILHNIALLHLVNPTVLAICRAFESDHQSLQGVAESYFVSRRLL